MVKNGENWHPQNLLQRNNLLRSVQPCLDSFKSHISVVSVLLSPSFLLSLGFPSVFHSVSLSVFVTVDEVYGSFIRLIVWLVGFRDLSRLTGGGFAAGNSFSLMREMEPFTAYAHFYACVCSSQLVYGEFERFYMWFYKNRLCEILCECLSQRVL